MATRLLYLEDFDVVRCEAVVQEIRQENNQTVIVLDQTSFYPRGGGQDWDMGQIKSEASIFEVNEVRLDETGTVLHIGTFQDSLFKVSDKVACHIDKNRRALNTRLHSAGHTIDMAVAPLKPDWVPVRGGHYPHMSFVEYQGELAPEDYDTFRLQLSDQVRSELAKNPPVTSKFISKDEVGKYCRVVPPNIPDNKPTRVVLYGDFGVACGGTHVVDLQIIGPIEITKVKAKYGLVKISYSISGQET